MPKTPANVKPMDVLKSALSRNVLIDVKGNREYSGILEGYDVYMNIVLQNASEIINGENKGVYDRVLVRGDNVIFVSPSKGDGS
ncbi:small nuclear ribonucleoprotein related protein [Thermoplasma acidophilum]|uniref:Putative snRNP Sm-like protein n=1 Tax=Thermoplasma acidophilum (strain ATCC 25905 / DSM 1728 / JCM 9062 / NBRC 15155 / AMRC-C165) TaxID=273075 RepID=RUXX_THEAC|nr:LSm family protein [Thermoplasma acidophilum]P57670.1 RecName: Full=Putative snRNP Sm-like protein [Thermoplasma acidophilum DSM 1728]MCY0851626.1 LSm family protein [Thermoplasma acidophilum]CAC12364.1 small nuclear ribonucleoprotein related protein [Thermoplasma acidophilum]